MRETALYYALKKRDVDMATIILDAAAMAVHLSKCVTLPRSSVTQHEESIVRVGHRGRSIEE